MINKKITLLEGITNCNKYINEGYETAFQASEHIAVVFNISKEEAMDEIVKYRMVENAI